MRRAIWREWEKKIQNPTSRRCNQSSFKGDHPLVLDSQDTQDFANSLTPVPHRWLRHEDHKDRVTNIVIITHRHKARFGATNLAGPLDLQGLHEINNRFAERFETRNGQVFSDSENDDIGECSVCSETRLLFECSMAVACKRWFHLACTPSPASLMTTGCAQHVPQHGHATYSPKSSLKPSMNSLAMVNPSLPAVTAHTGKEPTAAHMV